MRLRTILPGLFVLFTAVMFLVAPVRGQVQRGHEREQEREDPRRPRHHEPEREQELQQEQPKGSYVGKPLPNFKATDAITGEPLSLKDFRGKIVLVDFWAVWCPPCIVELPNIKKTYEKYHDKGFEIISISLDSDNDIGKCKQFIDRENMTWHHVIEGGVWDTRLVKKYNIQAIPAMFILDANGVVVTDKARGPALAKAIEEAMEKTPPTPSTETALRNAQDLLAAKDYVAAWEAFSAIKVKHPGTDAARAAQNHLKEMKSNKDVARTIEQARAEKERVARERQTGNWFRMGRSLAKNRNYTAARKYYQKIIDKFPDSEQAETARREMADLP